MSNRRRASKETVEAWGKRWLRIREERGVSSVGDDRSRLGKHVLPVIGRERMATIDATRLEDVRDSLDVKIRRNELSWRTAHHVWAVVRAMFRDARRSKDRSLRVRQDDACRDLEPPDRGPVKSKQFLFPNEFAKLVSCKRVPVLARRLLVVTTYLYLRVSELDALGWDDVDLAHGIVHVHRSLGRHALGEKPTKTGLARRFLIEPALMPLLLTMRREAQGRGRVLGEAVIDRYGLARTLRRHLALAGVGRPELLTNDRTRKWITFHDLRATGITWMAVRGDDPLKIRQRAGHRHLATTERYIRVAEELGPAFGKVFPTLPRSLLRF